MTTGNTQHTPGPWYVARHGTPDYAPQYGVYADGGADFAIIKGEKAKADAHLIAAAPDLLAGAELAEAAIIEAAQFLAVGHGTDELCASALRSLQVALAKARGQ
jgi:hypothetical protein